jgi:hypothetical protein
MTDKLEFAPVYRIRCAHGKPAGMWLSNMHVLSNGQRVNSPTWTAILQHAEAFTFHPEFLPEESAAYKMISRDVAEGLARVLSKSGIDAEVV